MGGMFTLLEFAARLEAIEAEQKRAAEEAMEKACRVVEVEAKRVIGGYEFGWPQLADATQQDRVQQGFSANEPGLRSGEMRESIEHHVSKHGGEVEGQIGSNDDHLVYFELGTSRQPPRSVLMEAAIHKEAEVVRILVEGSIDEILTGRGAL